MYIEKNQSSLRLHYTIIKHVFFQCYFENAVYFFYYSNE